MKNVIFWSALISLTAFCLPAAEAQVIPPASGTTAVSITVIFPPAAPSDLSASAISNSQINLAWTDNSNNETGFSIEEAVGNDSIFTPIDSVGPNVTTYSRTGLLASTDYFYRIRAYNIAGPSNYSNEASTTTPAAPVTPPPPPPPTGGGGGGGGSYSPLPNAGTAVSFAGHAFPKTQVTLLKDAQVVASTVASDDASFQMSLSGLSAGNYIFSLYGTDAYGNRSALRTFPLSVTSGASTNVSGIFIAPTLTTDKSTVKQGDPITFFGQTVPAGVVTIAVNSSGGFYVTTTADQSGEYLKEFDTTPLDFGQHTAYARTSAMNLVTDNSSVIGFNVGTTNVKNNPKASKGDLNGDNRVNIVDFSIMAYWYGKKNPPKSIDIGGFGVVDLRDFSILAYNWTG